MFPNLPARRPTGLEAAKEFGLPDGRMDGSQTDDDQENPALPAGFTYLGQFIDHDLTLDVFSELGRNAESGRLTDFRTPRLDMDNLYGVGPTVSPHLYDPDSRDTKLALSEDGDLARTGQGVALIGDPRNDENLIPAQFHLALIKFHYRVVDALRAGEINDALGRPLPPPDDQTPRTDLRGGAVLPEHALNWTFFFPVRSDRRHQSAKRITSVLDSQLLDLPVSAVPGAKDGALARPVASLVVRNLLRSEALGLPSGQDVARKVGGVPLTDEELQSSEPSYLWYYVLKEAEVRAGGIHPGPVRTRIVAEVLIGLLDADRTSYRSAYPEWRPTLADEYGRFTPVDLLRFAGATD